MLRTISKKKKIEKCDSSLATRQTGFWYLKKHQRWKKVFQKGNFFLTRKKKKKSEEVCQKGRANNSLVTKTKQKTKKLTKININKSSFWFFFFFFEVTHNKWNTVLNVYWNKAHFYRQHTCHVYLSVHPPPPPPPPPIPSLTCEWGMESDREGSKRGGLCTVTTPTG